MAPFSSLPSGFVGFCSFSCFGLVPGSLSALAGCPLEACCGFSSAFLPDPSGGFSSALGSSWPGSPGDSPFAFSSSVPSPRGCEFVCFPSPLPAASASSLSLGFPLPPLPPADGLGFASSPSLVGILSPVEFSACEARLESGLTCLLGAGATSGSCEGGPGTSSASAAAPVESRRRAVA